MGSMGFWRIAQQRPDWIAAVDPDGTEHAAAGLLARVNQITHGLRQLGLRPGDGIATLLPNGIAPLEVYLAAQQAGWYFTPVNWHFTAAEVEYIVRDSEAKAFFAHERFAADGGPGRRRRPASARAARISYGRSPRIRPCRPGCARASRTRCPPARTAGASMHYTSGTTGRPKGVRRPLADLSPEDAAELGSALLQIFGMAPGQPGVHLVTSPNYHTAVTLFAGAALHMGHTLVYMDKWDARGDAGQGRPLPGDQYAHGADPVQADADAARAGQAALRPVLHEVAHPRRRALPGSHQAGHAGLVGAVRLRVLRRHRGRRHDRHSGRLAGPARHGGPPVAGQRDPGGRRRRATSARAGVPGTVYMKMALLEFVYKGDPGKTAANRLRDFFTVGDIGFLDDDGFLFLCDRKADMIISGGVNIYPAEIEAELMAHPKVADVAVFGVPDEDWGEQVKAVVQPADG